MESCKGSSDVHIPRIMIAAAASGSGKTTIACALMEALKKRRKKVVAGKCGPDYIDPMFHKEVLGVASENLDLFFCEAEVLRNLFIRHGAGADIAVLEGVMGYYDGMVLGSDRGSSYEVAALLETPVILAVPCKGMAVTILAVIKGMIEFRANSNIKGILLNRISDHQYPRMKQMIEEGLQQMGYDLPVVGYVPELDVFCLESRHLGLVTPQEISDIKTQIEQAGEIFAKTVDIGLVEELAGQAPGLRSGQEKHISAQSSNEPVKIAVAQDAAFCFYYQDNLELLRQLGAELVFFSPLADRQLPEGIQGLIIGGGYPELYAGQLAENISMQRSIRRELEDGLPCLAECGGFMYLQEWLEDAGGIMRRMCGVIPGRAHRTGYLGRFGYIELKALTDGVYLKKGEHIRGHEFHYWDSSDTGKACLAVKPDQKRSWECVHMKDNLFAGYPHIHFYSHPEFAGRFIKAAKNRLYDNRKCEKRTAI